jgi:hypothetical protein
MNRKHDPPSESQKNVVSGRVLFRFKSLASERGLRFVAEMEFSSLTLLLRLLVGKERRRFLLDNGIISVDRLMAKHFMNKELGFFKPRTRLEAIAQTGDFDTFRKYYRCLSFDDLKKIYEIWLQKYPEQRHFDTRLFLSCIKNAASALNKKVKVVELGGYGGELAFQIFKECPEILEWLNIEIVKHKMFNGLEKYHYSEYVLSKQVWQEDLDISKYDIFISSDTLEHFTDEEVRKLITFIVNNKVKYLALKAPILFNGQTWNGAVASHVLNMGTKQIKRLLEVSYELIDEHEDGSWRSLWRQRNQNP